MSRNGVTCHAYTVEQSFLDADLHSLLVGQLVDALSLNIASRAIVEGSFTLLGQKATMSGDEVGASYLAATTTPVVNATSNIATILEAGGSIGHAKTLSFATSNSLAAQDAIANKFAVGIRGGDF